MRILMITATYTPSINGIAVAITNLKKSLNQLGHEVTVLAPHNPNAPKHEKGIIRYPSLENPLVKDYPIPLAPGIRSVAKLLRDHEPDLIHVHHPGHVGTMARVLAMRYGAPLVFTYHTRYDLYAKKYAPYLPRNLKKALSSDRVDSFCKKVDLIVAPSAYMNKNLAKKFRYQKIVTIPTGVTKGKVKKTNKSTLRKKLGIDRSKIILLSVGRVAREKNQEVLIQMMKNLDDKHVLVLVGDGPSREKLEKLSTETSVADRVYFTGWVPHSEVGNYYDLADYFVYSSQTETQGIIFLEALSHGLPILSVTSSAAREWVTKDIGKLTKSDPGDLAEKFGELAKLNKKDLIKNAKAKSRQFTAEKMAAQLAKEYQELISRKKFQLKIVSTGWQSWSTKFSATLRFPVRNYAPGNRLFLPKLSKANYKHTKKKPVKGWCSWYAYWWKISEEKIMNQVKWFSEHPETPIKYILIDDGWTRWGDWKQENTKRFPGGMKGVSRKIKEHGFKPGVWLAPFLVDPKAQIVKKYPHYLVRYNNKLVEGFKATNFDRHFFPKYILDIRKREVRKYLTNVIQKIIEEDGFELLKLDFLYAPYFIPGIGTREAGYYLHKFLLNIKRRYPNVYTAACGCPFPPALGVADSMRIGPDTSAPYLDRIPFASSLFHKRRLFLVRKNMRTRGWMKSYWNLDPDAFVCRSSLRINKKLLSEFRGDVKKMRSDIFLGDDYTKLGEDRIKEFVLPLFR